MTIGHKNTTDPEGTRNPIHESVGQVNSDSLAAESIRHDGGFAANSAEISSKADQDNSSAKVSTPRNTTDTTSSNVNSHSSSTSSNTFSDSDAKLENVSFSAPIGSDQDPSREAEKHFEQLNTGGRVNEAGMPNKSGQHQVDNQDMYNVLQDQSGGNRQTGAQAQNSTSSSSANTRQDQRNLQQQVPFTDATADAISSSAAENPTTTNSARNETSSSTSGSKHHSSGEPHFYKDTDLDKLEGVPASKMLQTQYQGGVPPAEVESHREALPLPDQPPTASDWQSLDARKVNI